MLSFLRARPRLLIISVAFVATVGLAILPHAPNQKNNAHPDNTVPNETGDLAEDIIAIFTVVLAGVGAITYLTFDRQADIMAGTLVQMKIDAANRAKETADQIQLARDEFIASHKPEIVITFLKLLPENFIQPSDQQPRSVKIGLVNRGDSTAVVTGAFVSFEILYVDEIPDPTELEGGANVWISPRRFLPGATDGYTIPTDQDGGAQIGEMPNTEKEMVVYGWIVYEDISPSRNTRTYYFCRRSTGEGRPFNVDITREVTY